MSDEAELPRGGYDPGLLRRLLGYLRPYRWHAAGALGLLVLQSGLALVGPVLTQQALDAAIPR
jgi:ABC-type multidrug transport system fused ATPase/permease subunit